MNYSEVQKIAKETIEYARKTIISGMTLVEVRNICEEKMIELGADSFWYYNIGAFVFSGKETVISISGKHYITSNSIIEENDIITIDLSPQNNHIWGDYARTLIVEHGRVISDDECSSKEWKSGILMEKKLHEEMQRYVNNTTTFEELYYHMNSFIVDNGYVNLDFLGNLGHSIVRNSDDRIYIEKGNNTRLSDVSFFTFEPHISIQGSQYGYKRENIYYFTDNQLKEL